MARKPQDFCQTSLNPVFRAWTWHFLHFLLYRLLDRLGCKSFPCVEESRRVRILVWSMATPKTRAFYWAWEVRQQKPRRLLGWINRMAFWLRFTEWVTDSFGTYEKPRFEIVSSKAHKCAMSTILWCCGKTCDFEYWRHMIQLQVRGYNFWRQERLLWHQWEKVSCEHCFFFNLCIVNEHSIFHVFGKHYISFLFRNILKVFESKLYKNKKNTQTWQYSICHIHVVKNIYHVHMYVYIFTNCNEHRILQIPLPQPGRYLFHPFPRFGKWLHRISWSQQLDVAFAQYSKHVCFWLFFNI